MRINVGTPCNPDTVDDDIAWALDDKTNEALSFGSVKDAKRFLTDRVGIPVKDLSNFVFENEDTGERYY